MKKHCPIIRTMLTILRTLAKWYKIKKPPHAWDGIKLFINRRTAPFGMGKSERGGKDGYIGDNLMKT